MINVFEKYIEITEQPDPLTGEVNVEEFIGIKSYKAKGKRLSTREIDSWQFLEPFQPEPSEDEPADSEASEPAEGVEEQNPAGEPEKEVKVVVNPADVPMEVVKPQGDGVQMDLFGSELE